MVFYKGEDLDKFVGNRNKGIEPEPRNFIVVIPQVKDDAKGIPLSIQVDQSIANKDNVRSGKTPAQTNPYLATIEQRAARFYKPSQVEAMKKAAGSCSFERDREVTKSDGTKRVYHETVIGIRATAMRHRNPEKKPEGYGFMINTAAPMSPTTNQYFPNKTTKEGKPTKRAMTPEAFMASQEAVTAAANEHFRETQDRQATTKEATAKEAPAAAEPKAKIPPTVEVNEPDKGQAEADVSF